MMVNRLKMLGNSVYVVVSVNQGLGFISLLIYGNNEMQNIRLNSRLQFSLFIGVVVWWVSIQVSNVSVIIVVYQQLCGGKLVYNSRLVMMLIIRCVSCVCIVVCVVGSCVVIQVLSFIRCWWVVVLSQVVVFGVLGFFVGLVDSLIFGLVGFFGLVLVILVGCVFWLNYFLVIDDCILMYGLVVMW